MFEVLRKRRNVRLFQEQAIEAEKIALLKEADLQSPSSRNLNP
jgi:nitroreductase